MDIGDKLKTVTTREDLASFVQLLREDLEKNPEEWENTSLSDFLDSLSASISSMDQRYRNFGDQLVEDQPWGLFAEMLLVAKYYE